MAYNDEQWQDEQDEITFVDLPDSELQPLRIHMLHYGRRLHALTRQPRLALLPSLFIILLLLVLLSSSKLYQHVTLTATPPAPHVGYFRVNSIQIISVGGTPQQSSFIILDSNNTWRSEGMLPPTSKTTPVCSTGTNIGAIHSVGSYPVWIKGILGPQAHVALTSQAYEVAPWKGWNITLQVAVIYNLNQPVTLSVFSPPQRFPAAFATSSLNIYSTSLTLDEQFPIQHNVPDGNKFRNIWNITLHIPASGCYKLQADWMMNEWSIFFTASPT